MRQAHSKKTSLPGSASPSTSAPDAWAAVAKAKSP